MKAPYIIINMLFLAIGCTASAQEAEITEASPKVCADCCSETQPPLGVMTGHMHPKGRWMLSYSYMDMHMQGNQTGTKSLTDEAIYTDYVMAPHTMDMQMHMLMLMYGLSDRWNLMLMGGFNMNSMSMHMSSTAMHNHNMPGMTTTDEHSDHMHSMSMGIADTRIYGMYKALDGGTHSIVASLGFNIPTGSTNVRGETMRAEDDRLAYPMQIGTGSWGILPSVTYTGISDKISWGASVSGDVKLNTNARGYRRGNIYSATAWAGYKVFSFLNASLRAEGLSEGSIAGYDNEIVALMYNDPNANAANFGGTRVNTYLGLNLHLDKKVLKDFQLLIEGGLPVYQNLNGPQMTTKYLLSAGLQYNF